MSNAATELAVPIDAEIEADEGAAQSHDSAELTTPDAPLQEPKVMGLSLAEATALGIENNLNVEIARHDPLIADANLGIAWSAYDPNVSGDFTYSNSDTAFLGNPFFFGPRIINESRTGGVGAGWAVPVIGADLDLRYIAGRADSNAAAQAPREYSSALALTGSVPLAKNLFWNQAWVGVRTSNIAQGNSRRTFEDSLLDAIASIEIAYWNLVAAREQLGVEEKSVESSRALLDQVKTQYEVGVVSKVDVVEAEAGVAEREFNLITADNAYRRAQDTLINAVLGTELAARTDLTIEPTDSPEDFVRYETDVEASVSRAFAQRPDLKNAEEGLESERLTMKLKRNQMLPQLDFRGGYTTSGKAAGPSSAGTVNNQFFDNPPGGTEYTLGGVFSIPLGNVRARKEATIAEINLRKANTALTQLRQRIILEVRDTVRNLASSLEGIDAAERRRAAAAEQLRAERVRLEHGESTPFDVLQRERDLVAAASQKIAALQTYRVSETNLLRSQGTLLESRNIVLEEAAPLRPAHDRW